MKRGEVWWVSSPREKRRPYLVLTRDAVIEHVHSVVAAPATRTVRGIPTEVEVGLRDGMPHPSAITLDNMTLLPKAFFVERICSFHAERMSEICMALRESVDC